MKWINTLPELAALTEFVKEKMSKKNATTKWMAAESAPGGPASDVFEQLRQLGQPRVAGAITGTDFDDKKTELLSQL